MRGQIGHAKRVTAPIARDYRGAKLVPGGHCHVDIVTAVRIHFVPGVVSGDTAGAIALGAELFNGGRIVAVQADPERRVGSLRCTADGRLGPVGADTLECAVVGCITGPVSAGAMA